MERIHTDLHVIPADLIPQALQLLIENGFIKHSFRDIRYRHLQTMKRCFPDCVAFFEVKSIY